MFNDGPSGVEHAGLTRTEKTEATTEGHYQEYVKRYDDLIHAAMEARNTQALSYRGFLVGSAVLAWNGRDYKIFSAGNNKPRERVEHGAEKRCAERQVLEAAEAAGYDTVVAMVNVAHGRLQGEQKKHGEVEPGVLLPCDECIKMFHETKRLMGDQAIFTSVRDSDDEDHEKWTDVDDEGKKMYTNLTSEERTLKQLLKLYPALAPAPDSVVS